MNRTTDRDLKTKHIEECLDKEILIGSVHGKGIHKRFTFHIWDNEYRVYNSGKLIDSGQAIEELLEVYNAI